jgi:hypothetical protein
MGGKKHISDWFSSNDDSDKNDKEVLSEYDKTINTIKLENMFKGTITICIVYAILGFILLLMSYLSESVRDLLFNKFLPFTIVYIIGSILIIIIMLYYIFSFKPAKIFKDNNIDEISCPDYWEVKIIDEKYIGDSFDPNYADDFKYKCVMNKNIFNKKTLFEKTPNLRMTNTMSNLLTTQDHVNKYNSISSNTFNNNYKKYGNSYNLYTDVNTNSGTYNETKKYITSNLGIYNDAQRVDNIFSNLRNISLLENNYSIGEDGKATDLLLEQNTTFNPDMNISIWTKDNDTIGLPTLSSSGANSNGMIIFNWNNLTYDILDNYLSQQNTAFIKVIIPHGTSGNNTNYCLGLIKYKDEDKNYIIFKPKISVDLKTIFDNIAAINKDSGDFLIKNTILYTWNKEALVDTDNYDNIHIGGSSPQTATDLTHYTQTNLTGPTLQLYDITKYRVNEITDSQLHGEPTRYISPLLCDTVYPKLLSRFEGNIKGNDKNNDIRCAYSKMCGIPWSDLHCN